jgi:pimeloyl-ACP methyl ester carboxylesterase
MATFVLVHGAWHGSWCWTALTPLLVEAGHAVLAVDLPCDDPSASFDDSADVVVRETQQASGDVVLVGHSMAGQTIPLVAELRPVRALVYLCALTAAPGRSLVEQLHAEPDMLLPGYQAGLEVVDEQGTTRWRDAALARETFFGDCPVDAAEQAFAALRPQAITPYAEPCRLTARPRVPTTYVLCADDRIVNPAWSRRAAPAVADVVIELPGGHSPFLSRPQALADILVRSLERVG